MISFGETFQLVKNLALLPSDYTGLKTSLRTAIRLEFSAGLGCLYLCLYEKKAILLEAGSRILATNQPRG